ncbi:acetate kinase [bacterium]|nr:acetate kinase [bacterium]
MKILVLNCGSSSVKFQLIHIEDETVLAKGIVEKIGSGDAVVTYQPAGKNKIREVREVLNHVVGIEIVLAMLLHPQHGVIGDKSEIDGIGHRVVHGGEEFTGSVFINEAVKAAIRKCIQFAPLHNPHNLSGIEACEALLSGVPQVAVFDTAFHHTIPPKAYIYGLPYALYKKLGIRRYGFHGTSHQFVARKAAEILNKSLTKLKMVTCHLGNGASITAVDGGKSMDTSMGFTPLEGLVMGTRCGDIDPALVPYIMEKENLSTKEINNIMNKNSGMMGLTETSNDNREIVAEAMRGSKQHQLALDIYANRVKKYIGAYMAEMGGLHAVIFTGGIGENSPYVRNLICANMKDLGLVLDPDKNQANDLLISTGKIKVLVIPTNEELAIARDTCKVLQEQQHVKVNKKANPGVVQESLFLTKEEKAQLVLIWAQAPNLDAHALAHRLEQKIGKTVPVLLVEQELEHFGLISPVGEDKHD